MVEIQPRDGNADHAHVLCPFGIAFYQAAQDTLELFALLGCGNDKMPAASNRRCIFAGSTARSVNARELGRRRNSTRIGYLTAAGFPIHSVLLTFLIYLYDLPGSRKDAYWRCSDLFCCLAGRLHGAA